KILGDVEPIDCRPADLLKPELETIKKECAEWIEQDEDVLSYAQFGQVATKFFQNRRNKKYNIDPEHSDKENAVHSI
ncbi:MAG: oxaloacetate decarboxylase subunit alpha, partial [Oscillospiraceae bacterium]